jgi:SAM-dependent methyltransferase
MSICSGLGSIAILALVTLAVVGLTVSPGVGSADDEGHGHGRPDDHGGGVERWLPRLEDPERDGWQKPDTVVALLDLRPGMTVVDVGAGTGYFLSRLDTAVAPDGRVIALDVDPELVDYMTARASRDGMSRVTARLVALDDPQLKPASADRIMVVNTWHHLPNREEYGRRLAAALRSGGFLMVIEPTHDAPVGPPPDHRLSAEVVCSELASAGFEAAVVDGDLPYQYVVVAQVG